MAKYIPESKILDKYADVLINFALGGGKGIKKGEIVRISVPEVAKPLYFALYKAVLIAGGNPLTHYYPSDSQEMNLSKTFYDLSSPEQISFFPRKYYKGLVNQIDHTVSIIAETDKYALKDIDPAKIMQKNLISKPYSDWLFTKENQGKFTWVAALYGTSQMAQEANLSLEDYWQQIIDGCFLFEEDPITKWKQVTQQIDQIKNKLNQLIIDKVHIEGKDANLWITIGKNRKWCGGGGRNIPSFEIFTSPDWRGTNGWIKFNQPLYRYGNIVKEIELEFKNGIVTKAKASHNQKVLVQMIKTKNTNKIGEFSLTDSRFSKITKFMAETLFDENIGGKEGNTHIALGMAYKDCYDGNVNNLSKTDLANLGFNDSAIHTDIVSTSKRKVTAILANGSELIIYQNGKFCL